MRSCSSIIQSDICKFSKKISNLFSCNFCEIENVNGRKIQIHHYLDEGIYPVGYMKQNKLALRKKAKYFVLPEGHYVGVKDEQRKTGHLRRSLK